MLGYTLVKHISGDRYKVNHDVNNYYVLTYEGVDYIDKNIADFLHIIFLQYINILKAFNAELIQNGYYFKNEDDAINAIIMLKLISRGD
jgi:hypothetical protein